MQAKGFKLQCRRLALLVRFSFFSYGDYNVAVPRKTNNATFASVRPGRRQLINLAFVLLLFYAIIPQLGRFRDSFTAVWHGQLGWVILAVACAIATSFVATETYLVLAKKRIKYMKTLMVQFASLFTGKLLPAGLGSLGLNFEYLRRQHHSQAAAGAVVATNNLLSLVGHVLLLSVLIATKRVSFDRLIHIPHIAQAVYWVVLGLVALAFVVLLWFRKLYDELLRTIIGALRNIRGYRTHPGRLLAGLLLSMSLTILYSLCLYSSAQAVGVHLLFGQALVVLTFGVAGSTIIPTPGGLGGAEAGLFAGLVAYNVPGSKALAVVLLYRFITYWLALGFGGLIWTYVRHQNYV